MLDNIINDNNFAKLMQKHIEDLVVYFFNTQQNFGILCKIEDVSFDPILPDTIVEEFRPLTLFFLAGYTFESANIQGSYLTFEAGFGADNHGSIVSVPLTSIMQVIVDETPLLINLATPMTDEEIDREELLESSNPEGVANSMASFLSNPENSKFVKD